MPDYLATFNFIDKYGRPTSEQVDLVATDEITALADLATARAAYQNGLLLGMQSEVVSFRNAISSPASGDVRLDYLFRGRKPDGYITTLTLKNIPDAAVNNDGTVDLTNANVKSILDLYLSTGGIATISDGETVEEWLSGIALK